MLQKCLKLFFFNIFFQMDLIIESETCLASSTDILNLTNELEKRMSKADAENVLRSLVRDKWLSEVRYLVSFSQELAC